MEGTGAYYKILLPKGGLIIEGGLKERGVSLIVTTFKL